MDARIQLVPKIAVCLQEDLEETRQVFFAEEFGGLCKSRPLLGRGGNEIGVCPADTHDQEVTNMADSLAAEVLQISAFFLKRVYEPERALRGLFGDGLNELIERVLRNDTEEFP